MTSVRPWLVRQVWTHMKILHTKENSLQSYLSLKNKSVRMSASCMRPREVKGTKKPIKLRRALLRLSNYTRCSCGWLVLETFWSGAFFACDSHSLQTKNSSDYCTFALKACEIWYPPTLTQACFHLFSEDNVSSLSHVEINTQTWVLAQSLFHTVETGVPAMPGGAQGKQFPHHCSHYPSSLSSRMFIEEILH